MTWGFRCTGICAMVDLVRSGALPAKGLVKQEQADLDLFLENRFGRYYARAAAIGSTTHTQA